MGKEEVQRKKTIRSRIESIQEELEDIERQLEKNKALFEARKKKWIQVKSQIEASYEEEKLATVKRVKQQLLKFQKRKRTSSTTNRNNRKRAEAKWQENIQKIKDQFSVRIEQLRQNLEEDKQQEIQENLDRIDQRKEKIQSRAAIAAEKAFEEGRKRGFAANAPIDTGAQVRQLEQKLAHLNEQSQNFFTHHVKNTMSSFYFALKESFNAEESYSGEDILSILMNTVKNSTFESLQQLDDEYRLSNVITEADDEQNVQMDVLDLGLDENQMTVDLENLYDQYQLHDDYLLPKKARAQREQPAPPAKEELVEEHAEESVHEEDSAHEPEKSEESVEEPVEEVAAEEEVVEEVEEVVEVSEEAEEVAEVSAEEVEPEPAEESAEEEVEPEEVLAEESEEGPVSENVEVVEESAEEEKEVIEEIQEEPSEEPAEEFSDEPDAEPVFEESEPEPEPESDPEPEPESEPEPEEDPEEDPEPEPEPVKKEIPKRVVSSDIFGDDDPLFSGSGFGASSKKEKTEPTSTKKDTDITSKFSSKPSKTFDLFGDGGDDLFGSSPSKTTLKKKSNLDDIFGGSNSSSGGSLFDF